MAGISGSSSSGRNESITLSVDVNDTNSVSDVIDLEYSSMISYCIIDDTGPNSTHSCLLQCSPDEVNWYDMPGSQIVGLGAVFNIECVFKFSRVKVQTAEGNHSTVKICIQSR